MKARLPGIVLIAMMVIAAPVSNSGAADPGWPASLTLVMSQLARVPQIAWRSLVLRSAATAGAATRQANSPPTMT